MRIVVRWSTCGLIADANTVFLPIVIVVAVVVIIVVCTPVVVVTAATVVAIPAGIVVFVSIVFTDVLVINIESIGESIVEPLIESVFELVVGFVVGSVFGSVVSFIITFVLVFVNFVVESVVESVIKAIIETIIETIVETIITIVTLERWKVCIAWIGAKRHVGHLLVRFDHRHAWVDSFQSIHSTTRLRLSTRCGRRSGNCWRSRRNRRSRGRWWWRR